MMSVFAQLFACCLPRKHSRKISRPDETTHLIPPQPQVINVDDATAQKQRDLQQRLTSIVRAKEGKMVNVYTRLPFNLHNRSLSTTLDPSSSRSASASILTSPASPHYPINYSSMQYSSPLVERSRQSSMARSSIDQHTSGEEEDLYTRTPILNLRLVNPVPTNIPRGRSPTKNSGNDAQVETEMPPVQVSSILPAEEAITSPVSTVVPVTEATKDSCPTLSVSPASVVSFQIQATEPLVMDWGE